MSRYDLTEFEWRVIEPLLPNKPEMFRALMTGACRTASSGFYDPVRRGAICPNAMARAPPATT
jgi:transposase